MLGFKFNHVSKRGHWDNDGKTRWRIYMSLGHIYLMSLTLVWYYCYDKQNNIQAHFEN